MYNNSRSQVGHKSSSSELSRQSLLVRVESRQSRLTHSLACALAGSRVQGAILPLLYLYITRPILRLCMFQTTCVLRLCHVCDTPGRWGPGLCWALVLRPLPKLCGTSHALGKLAWRCTPIDGLVCTCGGWLDFFPLFFGTRSFPCPSTGL